MQVEQFFQIENQTQKVLLIISASALFVQLFYYLFFYIRIFCKNKTKQKNSFPLSVIIAARNEADNLEHFLPKVLEQKYPEFQVIVVNDRSADGTEELLVKFRRKYPNFYFTNIEENPRFPSGKKLALTVGIKAAEHEHLVFIDADCYPDSELWLQNIANTYREKTQFVLAYGGYERRKGLINLIIRYETLWTGLQYLTFAKAGVPYMGVGRNLSYTKNIYEKQSGFSAHYHLTSGDDDLFVNHAARRKNTLANCKPESITRSVPKENWKAYLYQKVRHFTTVRHYRFGHKILLFGELFSRFVFYASLLAGIYLKLPLGFIIAFFAFRLLLQYITIFKAAGRFKEKIIAIFSPFFDILLPIIHLRISIAGIFIRRRKKRLWN